MMNDNNLTAQEKATLATALLPQRPDNTTPLHVTMHEEAPVEHAQDYPMVAMLLDMLTKMEKHIDMLVETKFNHLVANTKALSLMDEGLKESITEMIDEAIGAHCNFYDHSDITSTDEVSDIIASEIDDHISRYLSHHEHDLVSESRLAELVRDTLDEQLDEAIERKIDNATISICL